MVEGGESISYDHFGFPLDQHYIATSLPAPLRLRHFLRWARYWRRATRKGMMPEELRRSAHLRSLVWNGIPIAFRGAVWAIMLDVPQRRRMAPPRYYLSLLVDGVHRHEDDEKVCTLAVPVAPDDLSLPVSPSLLQGIRCPVCVHCVCAHARSSSRSRKIPTAHGRATAG